ncbi:Hypothetical predicted protein [Olea europaea subsp. europaea]|uniref:Uncharacterized protein n=1 Tax=Olea europaea subsp. europaea TaxID=158383 RepID=A0A8S0UFU9_OLEEU|nr:Hypothetical predicted protein [Olea europaea subsp. europaea]
MPLCSGLGNEALSRTTPHKHRHRIVITAATRDLKRRLQGHHLSGLCTSSFIAARTRTSTIGAVQNRHHNHHYKLTATTSTTTRNKTQPKIPKPWLQGSNRREDLKRHTYQSGRSLPAPAPLLLGEKRD